MKLLIVEDDLLTREMYEYRLKKAGHEVSVASTGTEGLEKAKSETVDGILLDIMLPEMDGVTFLKELRVFEQEQERDTADVIIISNLGQEGVVKECMKQTIKGYLIKARYTPRTLAEKVEQILNNTDQSMNGHPEIHTDVD
jgi:DNA-binding response OmpR family regulator